MENTVVKNWIYGHPQECVCDLSIPECIFGAWLELLNMPECAYRPYALLNVHVFVCMPLCVLLCLCDPICTEEGVFIV